MAYYRGLLQHLNSVIRIPPTHPTMQPATGVTPPHVEDTKEIISRCSPYAHLPQPGICCAPCHLTLLVINVEHLLCLFPGELSAPPPTSPFYDWMANNKTDSFVGTLCVSWVFYRDAQRNETTAATPCTILNSSRGYRHQIRTRSSCACLARGLKRHGATQTPPLWEDVYIMSEEPRSRRHCKSKSISQSSHPKIGSSKC